MRNKRSCLGLAAALAIALLVPIALAQCPCPGTCEGDLDGDCDVDLQDLAILLANYGAQCDPFLRASSWDCYDVKDNADILAKGGYRGVVSDGQYLYFVPDRAGSPRGTAHGEVLRYELAGDFFDPSSWETYDYGDHCGDNCTDPDSYCGGAFDGERYVYFAPGQRSSGDHSEVMRYDTWGSFGDATFWQTFDPGALGGYSGAVFAMGHVYFVPYKNSLSGEVLRYDTTADFSSPASWETFDAKSHPDVLAEGGYQGAVFDGEQYIYFVPYNGDNDWHGEVLRYDTNQNFTQAAAWETCDVVDRVGAKGGYHGGVFDGAQYIYFVPFANAHGTMHGQVLRFDTLHPDGFCGVDSWLFYDPGDDGVGTDPDGYNRAVFDGQYVYFVPNQNEGGSANKHGEVLRYDTSCDFTEPSSWKTFDYGEHSADCDDPDGYAGAVFVAPYIYFAPHYNGTEYHGEVLRYDTSGGN